MKILNENLNKDLLNKKNDSVDNIRSHDFAKREMMTNKSESPESFRHNNHFFRMMGASCPKPICSLQHPYEWARS